MGMAARHANGMSVYYENANWVRWGKAPSGHHRLYNGDPDTNGHLIASVPFDWIIEFGQATEVKHDGQPPEMTLDVAAQLLSVHVRGVSWSAHKYLNQLKKQLAHFDRRSNSWRKTGR